MLLVAAVVVLLRIFAKMFAPVKVLESLRSVDDAPEPPVVRQVPKTEKQPAWRLMPFAKVEDAVVEAT